MTPEHSTLNLAAHRLLAKLEDMFECGACCASQTEAWRLAWLVDLNTIQANDLDMCEDLLVEAIEMALIVNDCHIFEVEGMR